MEELAETALYEWDGTEYVLVDGVFPDEDEEVNP